MTLQENISLKKFNTFGIDVKAEYFAEVSEVNELLELLNSSEIKNQPSLFLGGGSNILFTADFKGVVIKLAIPGIEIIDEDRSTILVEAGAGVVWHDLVQFCVNKNFGGIENLSLIPGTAGAAPIQNIGAYGQEIKDIFESLSGYYLQDGAAGNFYKDNCRFGYRDSIFKRELKGKFIITKIRLRLSKDPVLNLSYGQVKQEVEKLNLKELTVKDVSRIICSIRKSKLPDPSIDGNAGSFFKNPEISFEKFSGLQKEFPDIPGYTHAKSVKLAAGWLIEKCGWKGKRVGNSGSHSKQALVLVNYGGASGKEVLQLAGEIKSSVYKKFGIMLEEEVNII